MKDFSQVCERFTLRHPQKHSNSQRPRAPGQLLGEISSGSLPGFQTEIYSCLHLINWVSHCWWLGMPRYGKGAWVDTPLPNENSFLTIWIALHRSHHTTSQVNGSQRIFPLKKRRDLCYVPKTQCIDIPYSVGAKAMHIHSGTDQGHSNIKEQKETTGNPF